MKLILDNYRKVLLWTFTFILCPTGWVQEGNIWYFGENAAIDFNTVVPTTTTGALDTQEGVATICDNSGSLLFYTDGETVWDQTDTPMPNGTGLEGHWSATQSAIIVPRTGFPGQYYIFTVQAIDFVVSPQLSYYRVDMNLPGNGTVVDPLGDVIHPSFSLLNDSAVEKISAVEKCDGTGFWVVAHANGSNEFLVYDVTGAGVTPVTSSFVGITHTAVSGDANELNAVGYMKFSPDGERLALVYRDVDGLTVNGAGVYLYDFDNATGTVSGETYVPGTDAIGSLYGIEFSPDGDQLYIGDISSVFRADLVAMTPITAVTETPAIPPGNTVRALQLAPDGNIYVALNNLGSLGRISNPNSPAAFIDPTAIALAGGSVCRFGLPTFVQSFFVPDDVTVSVQVEPCGGEVIFTGGTTLEGSITWNWDFGDGNTSNIQNPVHTYDEADGTTFTVTLTVTSTGGTCPQTLSVTTTVMPNFEPCCPAAKDPLFTEVITDITTDTYWTEKIYIPDDVIINVSNGAVLDITNVDVVFGECAGIDFTDGGMLRANNAVFRPCNVDGYWRGIQFNGSSEFDHIVNECTFKNASVALHYDQSADGVVSNSLFSNCNHGLYVVSSENGFNHPISGNRFVIDQFYPEGIGNCYSFTDEDIVYGIRSSSAVHTAEISHNNFLSAREGETNVFYGIDQFRSGGQVSENVFTNVRNPITINNPIQDTYVDNNEIEYNSDFIFTAVPSLPPAGVMMFNIEVAFVGITGNELRNIDQTLTFEGIYGRNAQNISITGNEIHNVNNGIRFNNCEAIEVTNNILTEITKAGILLGVRGNSPNFITCNDITMMYHPGTGIYVLGGDSNTTITSNCVKDSRNGIVVRSARRQDLPYIRNNYLYNYEIGIGNVGHYGNIGTAADPGLNTLWSNDNSATDIYSNTSITAADNFGMFNITFPQVMITSNNPYHSTASCGHQIFNQPSQGNLNPDFTCNNMAEVNKSFLNENGILVSGFAERIAALETGKFATIQRLIAVASIEDSELEQLMNLCTLSESEKALIRYNFYLKSDDKSMAMLALESVSPENEQMKQFKFVHLCELRLQHGEALTPWEMDYLNDLVHLNEPISNDAVAVLRNSQASHKHYIASDEAEVPALENLEVKRMGNSISEILLFPNPTQGNLTVNLINTLEDTEADLIIYDISGKVVYQKEIDFVAGQIGLDVSHLKPGVYLVSLQNDSEHTSVVRFTKM